MTLMEKCRLHWKELGINSADDLKKHIRDIFERNTHQANVLCDLYELVLPDFKSSTKVKGYPEAGQELWKFICRQFQDFDRMFHPEVMPGGAWMNWGFSVNEKLPGWELSFDNCRLVFQDPCV